MKLTLELAQTFEAGDVYEVADDNGSCIAAVVSSKHNHVSDGVWTMTIHILAPSPFSLLMVVGDEPITQWPGQITPIMSQLINWLESEANEL